MKKVTLLVMAIAALGLTSCSTEEISTLDTASLDANFRVAEYTAKEINTTDQRLTENGHCMETNLIAGQNYIAGTVYVDLVGTDLVITYATNGDWTISETHMSIGNCDDQSIPTNGGDNPKIGKFEHSSSHDSGVSVVTYTIDASVLDASYCFAAHAVVSGPSGGETAWAEGLDFEGNSWAMYVEALLSNCDGTDAQL